MKTLHEYYDTILGYQRLFSNPIEIFRYRSLKKIPKKSSPVSLRIRQLGGHSIFCRPGTTDNYVLWDTFVKQYHLPPIKLRSDCIIVDLGSNVGYTVVHFAYLYPKAKILAVEMDKDNLQFAVRNIHSFKSRCELIHAAIWSSNGQITYGGDEEWGFRILDKNSDCHSTDRKAPARSLDSIFSEYNLNRVDYLKMDIEGAEDRVFQGSLDWMDRVKSMKIEIHPPASIEACRNILDYHGFKCKNDDHHPSCLVAIR